MPRADAEAYGALARAFDGLGVRWYLFGAQAAILYGVARFTEDIDVTVELGKRPTQALIDALADQGFRVRITGDAFIETTRVVPLVHVSTSIPVDVVLSGPGLEEAFLNAAVEVDVDGISVPVARAEDLVVMKILAARPKDIEDIVVILAAQRRTFDDAQVRQLLVTLEEALDQSDLVSVFDTCVKRARRLKT
jgi:hypothetical protein